MTSTIFDIFLDWLGKIFTIDLNITILGTILAVLAILYTNSEHIQTELKFVTRRVRGLIASYLFPLIIPFSQNPFMLWIHPYPEWARRFFVPDNYYTMKEGYHSGGTTKYLPCMYSVYSFRVKWMVAVAIILFVGILFSLSSMQNPTNYTLKPYHIISAFIYFVIIFSGKISWVTARLIIFATISIYPAYLLYNNIDTQKIPTYTLYFTFFSPLAALILNKKTSLYAIFPLSILLCGMYSSPGIKIPLEFTIPTILLMAIIFYSKTDNSPVKFFFSTIPPLIACFIYYTPACFIHYIPNTIENLKHWLFILAFVAPVVVLSVNRNNNRRYKIFSIITFSFIFYNAPKIANFINLRIQEAYNSNDFYWGAIASIIAGIIIVPALPANQGHICNEEIAAKCTGKLELEGKSNKRLVTEYRVILISLLSFIVLFTAKVISIFHPDYSSIHLITVSSSLKPYIDYGLLSYVIYNFILTSDFFTKQIYNNSKKNKLKSIFILKNHPKDNKTRKNLKITRWLLIFLPIINSSFLINYTSWASAILGAYIFIILTFLIRKLYIKPNTKDRGLNYYTHTWIIICSYTFIFLNTNAPVPSIIYIIPLALLITILLFYIPKYFHASGKRNCRNKLEYGIYLWPLGLRAWSLLFGISLSAPIFFIDKATAIFMFICVTFLTPWCLYSLLRIPVLLDLWQGEIFYKTFVQGEATLNPYTRGLVRFWPFRCLPFFPASTNYRGSQSARASMYARIALHEIITSKMKISRAPNKNEDKEKNFSFFMSLKWFWFCCGPIWSSFLILLIITVAHSSLTGSYFQPLATTAIGDGQFMLSRYIFLISGGIWLILSFRMVSFELSRLSSFISYDKRYEGQAIAPLWVKARAMRAQEDFSEVFQTQTQRIIKLTLGAFASIYCVLLTLG